MGTGIAQGRRRGRGRPTARPPARASTFLYASVADELRRRIIGERYRPASAIPSEAELVREFGVSAITVRRAIRDLTFEGVLYGRQGRGVFVANRQRIVRVLRGDARTSIGDEIRRAGFEPASKALGTERITDDAVAGRLWLRRGQPVVRHEKLVLAGGEPVSIDTVYLPPVLAERLGVGLDGDFVFPLLGRHGIAVGRTELAFEGGSVAEAHAALLGLPPRSPLIVVRYTLYGLSGAPLLTGVTTARSDRFTFALTLPAEAAALPGARRGWIPGPRVADRGADGHREGR